MQRKIALGAVLAIAVIGTTIGAFAVSSGILSLSGTTTTFQVHLSTNSTVSSSQLSISQVGWLPVETDQKLFLHVGALSGTVNLTQSRGPNGVLNFSATIPQDQVWLVLPIRSCGSGSSPSTQGYEITVNLYDQGAQIARIVIPCIYNAQPTTTITLGTGDIEVTACCEKQI